MQTYYDERSETWQQGERAALLADHLDSLAQARCSTGDVTFTKMVPHE